MSMTQGEAVFQAVSSVFDTNEAVPQTSQWSDSQKNSVYEAVYSFFKSGATTHSGSPTDAQLKKYIPGLVNNWVRKDKRLNGGVAYQTKRPGSRSGTGDESIREMRKLLSVTTDPTVKEQIQAAITTRLEQLKPKVEVDVSKLPESIRHLAR